MLIARSLSGTFQYGVTLEDLYTCSLNGAYLPLQ